jgi:hypothetical protein
MLVNVNTLFLMKKTWYAILLLLGCNTANEPQKPVVPIEALPKQYSTPFANLPSTENIVMYEVNTRAFSAAGNFQGIIDRLDKIKALGVNTIWLMPIHPVGQLRSAGGLGSPYSVKDYKGINAEFGNLDKLRELVQKSHDKNMAVIIDWVANHTSWDNPWIANKEWYTQDGKGNIIIPDGTNWQDVADLNYDNGDMRKAMISAMKYWVLEANIDGFRCDAVDFVPTDFWKQAITELNKIEGRKLILLAEGGKADNFTAGFQMNYAWDFFTTLKQVYGENKSANSISSTHQAEYSNLPQGAKKLRYTTNHDLSAWEATPIQLFNGYKGALSASVITIFTSAVPLIYSSQEVGRSELLPFFTKSAISWTSNQSMIDQYEKLMTLYNSSEVFRKGSVQFFPHDDVALFKRTLGDEEFLIAVNVRSTSKEIILPASLQNTTWKNQPDQSSVTLTNNLKLDSYDYILLKKQ